MSATVTAGRLQQLKQEAEDAILSRKDAAKFLGVAEQTLAAWKTTGRYHLPVVKIGRLAKYRLSDLKKFIDSNVEDCGATS